MKILIVSFIFTLYELEIFEQYDICQSTRLAHKTLSSFLAADYLEAENIHLALIEP